MYRNLVRTPRWVKIAGLVTIAVVALLVVAALAGHGPGRHAVPTHIQP